MAEVAMVAPQRGRRDRSRLYKKHGTERPRTRRPTSSGYGLAKADPVDINDHLEATPARPRGDLEGTASLAAQLSGLGEDEPARLEWGRSDAPKRDARPRGTNTAANPAWPSNEGDSAMANLGTAGGAHRAASAATRATLRADACAEDGDRHLFSGLRQPNTRVQLRMDGRESGRPPSAATLVGLGGPAPDWC